MIVVVKTLIKPIQVVLALKDAYGCFKYGNEAAKKWGLPAPGFRSAVAAARFVQPTPTESGRRLCREAHNASVHA